MKEFAPAKVNLFLDVIRKREDGYHDLGTLFQTIDAGDTITGTLREDDKITLEYSVPQSYPKETDLVYRAAVLMQEAYQVGQGVDLYLDKIMPLGAGLGGGSADAAATLRLLNRLWKLDLPNEALEELGAHLGADVPFLVRGGSAFAEGIGDKLTFLAPLKLPEGFCMLVATPLDSVPTKDAYSGVSLSGPARWEAYKERFGGFLSGPAATAAEFPVDATNLFNGFEHSVFPKHPLVADLKERLLSLGAVSALMSGSGASVFAFFDSKAKAEQAQGAVKSLVRYSIVTDFWHGAP